MKTCIDCNEKKELIDFYKHPNAADRRMGRCKECTKAKRKERYAILTESQSDYDPDVLKTCNSCSIEKKNADFYRQIGGKFGTYSTCSECQSTKSKLYRIENVERVKKCDKNQYIKHRHKNLERRRRYYEKNKDEILLKSNVYCRERHRSDPIFKIRRNASRRIKLALDGKIKSGRTIELLGCTAKQAKKHIESQFQEGMSWENYSFEGWHIDHIKPCCAFDLSDPEQQKECFHYTNLQPLWAFDNMSKSGRWEND